MADPVVLDGGEGAARWHLVFTLLSMEATEPFWGEMGLYISKPAALREPAQNFVRQYRTIENDASLTDEQRLERFQRLQRETFQKISRELGRSIADELYEWGTKTFQYGSEEDAQAFLWRRLLRRLAGVSSLGHPLVRPELPDEAVSAIQQVVTRHLGDPKSLNDRIQKAELRESPWHRAIHATYSSDASPLDWVLNTIEFINFRQTWQQIRRLLNSEQMSRLLQWARSQAGAMEMPPDLIELPSGDSAE